ncbi:hypothetical protein [Luedemannella helvata]|uniref:Secreted protein n=1 Tax=Luedemannella helvata TaxID=349315 RepID=A0ABP4XDV4_9ACTN
MKRPIALVAATLMAAGLSTAVAAPAQAAPSSSGSVVAPYPTITVIGTVTAGVEMGCLILVPLGGYTPTGGGYLLIGGDRKVLVPGARVQVTGTLKPGTISFCMQGYPLEVISARPL